MRKVECLLLAFVLMMSVCTYVVWAQEDETLTNLQTKFNSYCTSKSAEYLSGEIDEYVEMNGIVYFRGAADFPDAAMPIAEKIGEWYIYSSHITAPDGIGLFVCKDGEVYHAKTAYESGIITDLSPFAQVAEDNFVNVWHIGNANGDGELNIKDATTVQKHLAGINTEKVLHEPVMDMNCDEQINIKDATAIQKKLADIK